MDQLLCIGELSEQQKMELETHKALVVDQRMQLSMLTQKLKANAELLEQKEQELGTLREKFVYVKISTHLHICIINCIHHMYSSVFF